MHKPSTFQVYTIYFIPLLVFSSLYLLLTKDGMGATSDSIQYEFAAKSFANSYTLAIEDGKPYVQWGPLYPIVLSLGYQDVHQFTKWLHFLAMNCCICLWISLFRQFTSNTLLGLLFGLSLACSTELMTLSVFIWSETIFMLLFAGFTLSLYRLSIGKGHWLLVSLLLFLSLLQRNAGIFLIAGILFPFLLRQNNHGIRLQKLLKISALGLSGFVLWNSWVLLWQTNKPTQFDYPEGFNIIHNAKSLLHALSLWIMPNNIPQLISTSIISMITLVLLRFCWVNRHKMPFLVKLSAGYSSYLLVWFIVFASNADIIRFTSIVYPLFFLLGLTAIWNWAESQKEWLKNGVLVMLYSWLLYPAGRLLYHLYHHI